MADDIDRANDQAQQILEHQLAARKPTRAAKGTCHYCEDQVEPGKLFCNTECRDDFEREQRIRGRNGRNA